VPEIVFATAPSRRFLAQMSQVLLNRAPNGWTASQHWALGRHDSPVEGAGFEPSVPR
jgi:hypothetical protein